MANPFEYSDPVLGDSFADRKAELQTLASRMLTGQNVVVISPRRYGKTSLILNAQGRVRRRGGRTGIANLFWCRTRQDVAQELANAVVRGPLGWLRGRMEEMRRRLGSLPGATLTVEKDGFQVSLSPIKPQSDWTAEIRHVMKLLQDVRSAGPLVEADDPPSLGDDHDEVTRLLGGTVARQVAHPRLFGGKRRIRGAVCGPGRPIARRRRDAHAGSRSRS